jgi:flavodoxin
MKALIVYDTKYGMTEKVAQAIGSGMRTGGVGEVQLRKAENVTAEELRAADAWVFGSPVHIGGATRAAKHALKDASKLAAGKKVSAFDTRFANSKGAGAAGKLADGLKETGAQMVAEPQWFIVDKTEGPLADGEEAKATEFGKTIAQGLKA